MVTSLPLVPQRLRRPERLALLIAAAWSVALLVAAAVVPVYQSETVADTGETRLGSETLVAVNGPGVLLVVALPLLVTIAVGLLLHRRAGRAGAGPTAWILVGLLAGFCALAMLSIGIYLIPVVVCLGFACFAHRRGEAVP